MLDADGMCVCDDSVMNVRIKMNVNVNLCSYYSYFRGFGVANLFGMFAKYKAFIGQEVTCLPCVV